MKIQVTVTPENVTKYPLHKHDVYEIIYYVDGNGFLHTQEQDYPFQKGTILLVPPNLSHGSVSERGFQNICVHTDDVFLDFSNVIVSSDNTDGDVETLAKMLLRIYFGELSKQSALFSHLYNAYRETVLKTLKREASGVLEDIVSDFAKNLSNPDYSPLSSFYHREYAVDYLRVLFKNRYQKTPSSYFTELRISYAKSLLDLYGKKLKQYEIASLCGFTDPLYFSKTFKKIVGVSPTEYIQNTDR